MVLLGNTHGCIFACVGTSLMLVEHLKERDLLRAERELLQTNIAQLARSVHRMISTHYNCALNFQTACCCSSSYIHNYVNLTMDPAEPVCAFICVGDGLSPTVNLFSYSEVIYQYFYAATAAAFQCSNSPYGP